MAGGSIHNLIRFLRRTTAPAGGPAAPDDQLLERFAATGDDAAFEILARRHGPMVLGVCRRVLGDSHEAEDAFQATFLVLARKAASAARCRSAGGWLHTVASRVALRARARRAARAARERPLDEPTPSAAPGPAEEAAAREFRQTVDEEVSRLPEKYRVPFVLFHLEGRSSAEVAGELGCPVGTVESWLTRARARLRRGLTRRGLAPVPALLAALAVQEGWTPQAAAAARSAGQGTAGAVSPAAADLAGEVMRAFGAARLRVALLLLAAAAGAAALVAGMLPREEAPVRPQTPAARRDEVRPAPPPRPPEPRQIATLKAAGVPGINALAPSPSGTVLASGDMDGSVTLWDWQQRKLLTRFEHSTIRRGPTSTNAAAFSLDGKTLASGARIAYTRSTGGVKVGEVKVWEVATRTARFTFQSVLEVNSVALSPDGKALAAALAIKPAAYKSIKNFKDIPTEEELNREVGEVKVWDLATGRERTFFHGDRDGVKCVAFSPDGKTLASAGRDGVVRLWDAATGKELPALGEKGRAIRSMAFSPDRKTLAVLLQPSGNRQAVVPGQHDGGVALWDVAARRVRARLEIPARWFMGLAFSPDGKTLATAGDVYTRGPGRDQWQDAHGEVRLWDAATGRPHGPPLTVRHSADAVAYEPRGRILAAGGAAFTATGPVGAGMITLWDLHPRDANAR